jgi:hypothetical protein
MESRLWNQIQLNEAVTQADHGDLSEQRLERSSTEPRSEKSLVLTPARACHVDNTTTKSNAACKQAEDPFDPVKSPDFSIHSPTMLHLLSLRPTRMRPGAQCLPSLDVKQEEPSEMNYEYGDSNYSAPSNCASTPLKKRARPCFRRNSVVVHRRQGDIASMFLRPSITSSPMSDESAMPPFFNRKITESPLDISRIASEVFPSRRGSKKRKTNPDHVSHEESEE